MNRNGRSYVSRSRRTLRAVPLVVAAGIFVFSVNASSVEVEHVILDVEDVLGPPAIQAAIVNCIGETLFFTGTVHITMKDGVATHYNWGPMRGETLDGDVFAAGSGVTTGKQSNVTVAEVGAGRFKRLFRLHVVHGEVSVTCHV